MDFFYDLLGLEMDIVFSHKRLSAAAHQVVFIQGKLQAQVCSSYGRDRYLEVSIEVKLAGAFAFPRAG